MVPCSRLRKREILRNKCPVSNTQTQKQHVSLYPHSRMNLVMWLQLNLFADEEDLVESKNTGKLEAERVIVAMSCVSKRVKSSEEVEGLASDGSPGKTEHTEHEQVRNFDTACGSFFLLSFIASKKSENKSSTENDDANGGLEV